MITFEDGSTISYLYSADGAKLRTTNKVGSLTTTTDYCGNVIYENGIAKLLLTEEGYVSLNDKKYHYYPFGGVFASAGNVQPYKYNGKELDTKKGLNWYDYGARQYDAVLGRFTTMDPLAEKYYSIGTNAYCSNSPIRYVDPMKFLDKNTSVEWGNTLMQDAQGNSLNLLSTSHNGATIKAGSKQIDKYIRLIAFT